MKRELQITNIRDLLNNYREQNGWSIPALAKKIGMNDSSLQIILSGKRDITLEMIHFCYYTFGEEVLNNLISNDREDKMIKEYINPITRNEERLLIRKYCREEETTIEQIAKDHGVTPSVLSRMITREFSANEDFYRILKNIGLTEELEDLLLVRNEYMSELEAKTKKNKSENIFYYNTLIMKDVLESNTPFIKQEKEVKVKTPAIRNSIGNLGAELRKINGLSFSEMAKLLDCSPSTIQSMESSKIPFNIDYYSLLIKYGFEERLIQEMELLKEEILPLKHKNNLTKEEKNKIKSYRNYIDQTKTIANKRPVNAKSIVISIEESIFIKELSKTKPIEQISIEMGVPISSIHLMLLGKQRTDKRFYDYLIEKGYKEKLEGLLTQRTPKYHELEELIERNSIIFHKNLKESEKVFKHNILEHYNIQGTLNIKHILSPEDYIFYHSYRTLYKCLKN